MIICIETPGRTKKTLDALMESGQYSDYGEVITVAVENLAVLQQRVRSHGPLVFDTFPEGVPSADTPGEAAATFTRASLTVPQLFANVPEVDYQTRAALLPPTPFSSGDAVPLERWLFGQYNRILPVKASCRGLANMLVERTEGVSIEEAIAHIVVAASQLGRSLRGFERDLAMHRDNALSTAFPSSGKRAEKSKLRFGSQFVAATTRTDDLTGCLSDLRLINYVSASRDRIGLTEPGWRFALASNPVLDNAQEEPTQKLGDDEVQILLSHIRSAVPPEDFAFRSVLTAVRSGVTSPSELDEAMTRLELGDPVTAAFASTQRSGVVARMVDLGLLVRSRDGVRVEYMLTENGADYLSQETLNTGERT